MLIESNIPSTEISESGITVLYVTAAWCGPCKVYGPQVQTLAEEFTDVKFIKADADAALVDLGEVVANYKTVLRSVPTTMVFKDGALQTTFTGNDATLLKKTVENLM